MGEGDYTINNIYQGGHSSFSPDYGDVFSGYHVAAGSLALVTDPRTADLIKDTSAKLATGVKNMELTLISPELFDSIPKDHFKEVNRLRKITGVDVSVHGPIVEPSGVTQQGFSEVNREAVERRMIDVVERSHEIKPEGNGIVVFHSTGQIPSTEWKPSPDGRKVQRLIAVNRENGSMVPLEEDIKYYPDMKEIKPEFKERYERGELKLEQLEKKHIQNIPLEKGQVYSPEKNLESHNATSWDNQITQLFFNQERADEILQQNEKVISHLLELQRNKKIREEEILSIPEYANAYRHLQTANNYIDEIGKQANGLFSKAYEYGSPDQKKELLEVSEQFKKDLKSNQNLVIGKSFAMRNLLNNLKKRDLTPQLFIPVEEFTIEKSSKTFGNTAFAAYKKFGDKAPVIAIENPPAGGGLSTGKELRKLVDESRKQFIEKAISSGISESQARDAAEKLIGATWDVGHINMIRKYGFSEKDVVKETEAIAPVVKHIHLSDNFGFEHTELPMGMGNVPLKEMLEKLPQKDIKKVIEAGSWWTHMRKDPVKESLIGLGSYFFTGGGGPSWNQGLGLQQDYMSGYEGNWLPQRNYETFGTTFSRLPKELGGSNPGGSGRMGGTPME